MSSLGLLALRVHSSPDAGYGHIMRCRSLAQEWVSRGGRALFLLDSSVSTSISQGIRKCPHHDIVSLDVFSGSGEDFDLTTSAAKEASFVVLDGYCFSSAFQHDLPRTGRMLCIDDCAHSQPYAADIVLSQDIGYDGPIRLLPNDRSHVVLSGPNYILLREEFRSRTPRPTKRSIGMPIRVLMTAGGGDPDGLLARFVRIAAQLGNTPFLKIIVMTSATAVEQSAVGHWRSAVTLACDVENVPELMSNVDFAISAGGTTLLELAYMGVPTYAIAAVESQQAMVDELHRRGVVRKIRNNDNDIVEVLRELPVPPYWNNRGQELVDGYGSVRVVNVMQEMLS